MPPVPGRDLLGAHRAVVDHARRRRPAGPRPSRRGRRSRSRRVEGLVGVGLELDRRTVLQAGLLVPAAGEDVDLGVVREVEAAARAVVLAGVVELAAMGEEAHEAGEREVERPARPNLRRGRRAAVGESQAARQAGQGEVLRPNPSDPRSWPDPRAVCRPHRPVRSRWRHKYDSIRRGTKQAPTGELGASDEAAHVCRIDAANAAAATTCRRPTPVGWRRRPRTVAFPARVAATGPRASAGARWRKTHVVATQRSLRPRHRAGPRSWRCRPCSPGPCSPAGRPRPRPRFRSPTSSSS